jgi:hypothetical protein
MGGSTCPSADGHLDSRKTPAFPQWNCRDTHETGDKHPFFHEAARHVSFLVSSSYPAEPKRSLRLFDLVWPGYISLFCIFFLQESFA